jgi:hypothetical protein
MFPATKIAAIASSEIFIGGTNSLPRSSILDADSMPENLLSLQCEIHVPAQFGPGIPLEGTGLLRNTGTTTVLVQARTTFLSPTPHHYLILMRDQAYLADLDRPISDAGPEKRAAISSDGETGTIRFPVAQRRTSLMSPNGSAIVACGPTLHAFYRGENGMLNWMVTSPS